MCQVLYWATLGTQVSHIRSLPVRNFRVEGGTDMGAWPLLRLGTQEGMRLEALVLSGQTDKQQIIQT